jgi:hypothetical protein
MSRTLSAGMLAAIAEGVVRPHMLVEADFPSGMTRFTTAPYSVTWDGNIYTGLGHLLSVDTIEEREQLSAYGVRLALSAVPSDLVATAMGEHYQGRSLAIYQALFDDDHQIIADPLLPWSGFMDVMTIELAERTATVTLTGVHRLHDMDRPRGGRYNDGDQQSRYAGDLYFQFLEELQNSDLMWGYWLAKVDSRPRDSGTSGYVQTGNGNNDAGTRGYTSPGVSQIARDSGTRG